MLSYSSKDIKTSSRHELSVTLTVICQFEGEVSFGPVNTCNISFPIVMSVLPLAKLRSIFNIYKRLQDSLITVLSLSYMAENTCSLVSLVPALRAFTQEQPA